MVRSFGLILALIAIPAFANSSSTKGSTAVRELQKFQIELRASKGQDGKPISYVEYKKALTTKAQTYLTEFDPKNSEAGEGLDWSTVLTMAGRYKDSVIVLDRYLDTAPSPSQKFEAQQKEAEAFSMLEDLPRLITLVPTMTPTNQSQVRTLAYLSTGAADSIEGKQGPEAAIEFLDKVEPKSLQAADNVNRPSITAIFFENRTSYMLDAGKVAEAKALAAKIVAESPKEKPLSPNVVSAISRVNLYDTSAPELVVGRRYGDFTSLSALRGKVVVLDFFAHWCGPCKESMPDTRKMTDELGSGLQVIGATEFYGSFEGQTKLSEQTEYDAMKGFMEKHRIDHPVVYVGHKELEKYGCSGIPEFIVIDKKGIVRKIQVGYDAPSFASMRTLVEGLLKE